MIFALKTLLTAQQAADLLCIPTSRLYELVREGKLRCVRFGRTIRFSEEALEEFVATGGVSA
jgi:excisionase family DNA binding protein